MDIPLIDIYLPDCIEAFDRDDFNVSKTCDYNQCTLHHIHNSCEILFAVHGTADYSIMDNWYRIEPGDILVISAMHHHVRTMTELPFVRYGLTVLPSYFRSFISDMNLLRVFETPSPEQFEKRCKHIEPVLFSQIVGLLEQLYQEAESTRAMAAEQQKLLVHQIAVLLYRAFRYDELDEIADPFQNKRMQEIKEYINEHYSEPITLESLGNEFFMHPTNICKYFSKYCGFRLNQYINAVRVCQATDLLEHTDLPMTVIAEKTGFGSLSTFLRQFKAIISMSPLQYRKRYREYFVKRP
jgi:AraC-like DNA-binding protein